MLKKLILWPLGLFVGGLVVLSLLPTFESMANTFLDASTTAVQTILPKFALGALTLGVALLIPHWTRVHARKMIVWAFVAVIVSGSITTILAWGEAQSATIAPTALALTGDVISKVVSGLSAGLH